ncbi:MAG: excinuclease ABC subunit UvrB [Kiritimatiellaeota bacterium]|nr:excinuclease ABC subunit UvrB [Kiritimatiellota bacterium]
MSSTFQLQAPFPPSGDQPGAIEALASALERGETRVALEGVTGSGKTFTMANIIQRLGKPALILSHNKTLAAQLFTELKSFFPENAVEYFISYYDYYQPEAYIPQTGTFIEKDASINEEIERYRLAATNALIGRRDVVVVASVSCIYGLGSPEDYRSMLVDLSPGLGLRRDDMLAQLVDIQYQRNDYEPRPGVFRVRGDIVDIFPSYTRSAFRVEFFGDTVDAVREFDPATGRMGPPLRRALISPARHFVMPREKIKSATAAIRDELRERVAELEKRGKLLEAQRLQERTNFDLEMLRELGHCSGIENYSRHLAGRAAGEAPACLLDYFDPGFLTIIDESHATLPQLRAMFNGDQARKQVLVDYGFRLPSAKDNRPLNFDEFLTRVGPVLFTSATPGPYEREVSTTLAQQIIRPTGLLDPPVELRPLGGQIDDVIEEIRKTAEAGNRTLVTTLTKRTAEDLAGYLRKLGLRVEYLHSDIDALERVDILRRLRLGEFDCLVGINLLREGLDLPEVALVAVLDADKEGFLRSQTSLIQTAGRTARHQDGRVILYADKVTDAIRATLDITADRRRRQMGYNAAHNITPKTIIRAISEEVLSRKTARDVEAHFVAEDSAQYDVQQTLAALQAEMLEAANHLEFERAAALRDEIKQLKAMETTDIPLPEQRAVTYPASKTGRGHSGRKPRGRSR